VVSGTIVKIVNSYGSKWGHVRPEREPRQLFFNAESLVEGDDFAALAVGDLVEFNQEPDRANGLRATQMRRLAGAPVSAGVEMAAQE
jgi:cold shock CspA family protein